MTAALDLGSSEFRSLRREDDRLIARRLPAVYTVIDDQPAHRRMLEQSQIPYSPATGSLVVVGESALEVSALLSRPLIPLLTGGRLADDDAIGRQVCAWLIELLLPPAGSGIDHCVMTMPRGETATGGADGWTTQFLEHIVQLRGYQTSVLHPALAVALAELDEHEFTGACLTIGAESITFAITRCSQLVVEGRFTKGSREILERFAHARKKYLWDHAGNVYLDLPAVHRWLQQEDVSLRAPQSDDESWLRDAFEEQLLSAWFSLKRKITRCEDPVLRQPLPLIVSGTPARLSGMMDIVAESLMLSGLPLQFNQLRPATFDPYSVARGLLIHATLAAGQPLQDMLPLEAA